MECVCHAMLRCTLQEVGEPAAVFIETWAVGPVSAWREGGEVHWMMGGQKLHVMLLSISRHRRQLRLAPPSKPRPKPDGTDNSGQDESSAG
jgi:hypothetical protein